LYQDDIKILHVLLTVYHQPQIYTDAKTK